jgi:SpoVK/Ycf46/Vps4 family AAA+-type ATPase
VQAESNHVFGMLAALEQTVVFLDEFDELMRERTSRQADVMSRFLTTAMLPKLTSISDSRRVVFLLATNHVSQFDFAIRRPGRFDMVIQIMPPTWQAKQTNPDWARACGRIVNAMTAMPELDQAKFATMLDGLTFGEFNSLCSRITDGQRDEDVASEVEDASKKATLNQLLDIGGKKRTWQEQCNEDEKLNRFL